MTLPQRLANLPAVPGLATPNLPLNKARVQLHQQRTHALDMYTRIAGAAIVHHYPAEVAARLAPIVALKVEEAVVDECELQAQPRAYTLRTLATAKHALDCGSAPPAAATDDILVDYLVTLYSNPEEPPPSWQPQAWLRDMNNLWAPGTTQDEHQAGSPRGVILSDSEDEPILKGPPPPSSTPSASNGVPSASTATSKKRKTPPLEDDSADPDPAEATKSVDGSNVLEGKPGPRSVKLRRLNDSKGSVSPPPVANNAAQAPPLSSSTAKTASAARVPPLTGLPRPAVATVAKAPVASTAAAVPRSKRTAPPSEPPASDDFAATAPDRQLAKARATARTTSPSPTPSISSTSTTSSMAKPVTKPTGTAPRGAPREPVSRSSATRSDAPTVPAVRQPPPTAASSLLSTLGLAGPSTRAPPSTRRPPVSASASGPRPPVSASASGPRLAVSAAATSTKPGTSIADLIPTQRSAATRTKPAPPPRTNSAPATSTLPSTLVSATASTSATARKPTGMRVLTTTSASVRPGGPASARSSSATTTPISTTSTVPPIPSLYLYPALTWGTARAFVLTRTQLERCDYPLPSRLAATLPTVDPFDVPRPVPGGDPIWRKCARCGKSFDITSNESGAAAKCTYHWGRTEVIKDSGDTLRVFGCCQGGMGSIGCTESVHVYHEDRVAYLHAVAPFVETPPRGVGSERKRPALEVVALDCEMCYTSLGMEVCRVTAIDQWKRTVIDELVKPKGVVRDLNTRYSGIKSLKEATKTLADIHSALFEVMDDQTILVGHGLENDLKALRLVHYLVVDTSELFRRHEADRKPSLKKLADSILARTIQQGGSQGHDSAEDATAALDLLIKKIADPDRTIFQG